MKLSPPASSSDLEAAREIARRLHQHRRREDRLETEHHTPAERAPGFLAARPHPSAAPSIEPALPTPPLPPAPPPAAPSWDAPVAEEVMVPEAPFDALAALGSLPTAEEAPAGAGVLGLEVEEPGVSPEEMVGVEAPEPPSVEDLPEPVTDANPPSFEVELDEPPTDEMIDDVPAPPLWDDVVVACLDHAQARGAMLVDPAGRVFAARGDWPEPGPDAIALKLVATMDRTLKDAPTRSISAPLMGKQLTAWRVALAEGLVTAAFIGDSAVRAETRPAIDAEIRRGAGA
jgi:hypothetical protein